MRPVQRGALALFAAAALALGGCASLDTRDPDAAQGIAGDWQRDEAASDNFDHKLGELLDARLKKLRAHHGSMRNREAGAEGRGGAPGGEDQEAQELDEMRMLPEESARVRTLYADDLRPPAALHVGLDDGGVQVTSEGDPVRLYVPGQVVSRIDSSGAAQIACGWDQRAFVVRASYVHKASRTWRYALDATSGTLRLDFEATDPEFGTFTLRSVYRRAGKP